MFIDIHLNKVQIDFETWETDKLESLLAELEMVLRERKLKAEEQQDAYEVS